MVWVTTIEEVKAMARESLEGVMGIFPAHNFKVEVADMEYATLCVRYQDDDEWRIRGD